jgi:hypothetical protein
MKHVFFKPWVGRNYFDGDLFPKRILILGESHYQWDKNIPLTENITNECILEQIEGDYTKQFWTNIVIAFLNKHPSIEDKRRFWHSVAFYNYIQGDVGFGPRVRPTEEMWVNSQQAFLEVLEEYNPKCIIVLGFQLWKNLPSTCGKGPKIDNATQTETRKYPTGNDTYALAYGIRHPAAGFSAWYWYPFIMQAIALA